MRRRRVGRNALANPVQHGCPNCQFQNNNELAACKTLASYWPVPKSHNTHTCAAVEAQVSAWCLIQAALRAQTKSGFENPANFEARQITGRQPRRMNT